MIKNYDKVINCNQADRLSKIFEVIGSPPGVVISSNGGIITDNESSNTFQDVVWYLKERLWDICDCVIEHKSVNVITPDKNGVLFTIRTFGHGLNFVHQDTNYLDCLLFIFELIFHIK